MNSFVNAASAIEREVERQTDIVTVGGVIVQETLLYDAVHGTLATMRSKEEAHDYRYFPEPDLVPVHVTSEWIEEIHAAMPELRHQLRARFERQYSIPEYNADVLTSSPSIAGYYEAVITGGAEPVKASNWVMAK